MEERRHRRETGDGWGERGQSEQEVWWWWGVVVVAHSSFTSTNTSSSSSASQSPSLEHTLGACFRLATASAWCGAMRWLWPGSARDGESGWDTVGAAADFGGHGTATDGGGTATTATTNA